MNWHDIIKQRELTAPKTLSDLVKTVSHASDLKRQLDLSYTQSHTLEHSLKYLTGLASETIAHVSYFDQLKNSSSITNTLQDLDKLKDFSRPFFESPFPFRSFSSVIAMDISMENVLAGFQRYYGKLANQDDLMVSEYDLEEVNQHTESERGRGAVVHEAKRLQQILLGVYHNNAKLLELEPREFEEVFAELMRSQGFEVELTKQAHDGGYDLLAIKQTSPFFPPSRYLVECKHYKKGKVGIDVVRSFLHVVHTEQAHCGIIATTNYFTKDAQEKRQLDPYRLDYKDRGDVIALVNSYVKKEDGQLYLPDHK